MNAQIQHQDDFTNRMCENQDCNKEFDLKDPHYYDEEQGVCYCCKECFESESESETETTYPCANCGCDGMYEPDDTCSRCILRPYKMKAKLNESCKSFKRWTNKCDMCDAKTSNTLIDAGYNAFCPDCFYLIS